MECKITCQQCCWSPSIYKILPRYTRTTLAMWSTYRKSLGKASSVLCSNQSHQFSVWHKGITSPKEYTTTPQKLQRLCEWNLRDKMWIITNTVLLDFRLLQLSNRCTTNYRMLQMLLICRVIYSIGQHFTRELRQTCFSAYLVECSPFQLVTAADPVCSVD